MAKFEGCTEWTDCGGHFATAIGREIYFLVACAIYLNRCQVTPLATRWVFALCIFLESKRRPLKKNACEITSYRTKMAELCADSSKMATPHIRQVTAVSPFFARIPSHCRRQTNLQDNKNTCDRFPYLKRGDPFLAIHSICFLKSPPFMTTKPKTSNARRVLTQLCIPYSDFCSHVFAVIGSVDLIC